ncbi:MAG: wax ester/triacylglycerol synthase family O-acyltransferase [Acidimicrobiia bacterium]|nr:wax ester/triacylglycerol synthase family O-acyltransferase [Acidimicrobiia bacterium]
MSGTDSLFLAGETPNWHQHIAGLVVLDPSNTEDFSFETVFRNIGERLALVPKLTWKLKTVPFGLDRSHWVDDDTFDLRRHFHQMSVPAPGGPRQTADAIAPILGRQLDRRFPLWEMWYLDGLAHGRVAVLMKMHHCILDGGAGSVLATLLFDIEPNPPARAEAPPTAAPEPPPSDLSLIAGSLVSAIGLPLRRARYLGQLALRGVDLVGHFVSGRERPNVGTLLQAPKTSFNVPIGPRRSLAFSSVALADVKAVARKFDVKVNDVALAVCSGAIRSYLDAAGELPERELTAGAPVSLRKSGDASMDNQLSYLVMPLGTQFADPIERLQHIAKQSHAAKDIHRTMRAHPVSSIAETASPFLLGSLMRLAYQTHVLSFIPGMMNTVISNVPGPPMDLYLAGAKLSGIFSASVLLDCMGLNVTLFTFGDRVDFGLHVDPDLIEDPWVLAEAIPNALRELMLAAELGQPTEVADAFGFSSVDLTRESESNGRMSDRAAAVVEPA